MRLCECLELGSRLIGVFQTPTDPPLALGAMAAKNDAPSEATTSATLAADNAGLTIEAMQAAGDTGMPTIHELATLASASASLSTQAQAGKQPRTGHVDRKCHGSSASMVAHASMTSEAARFSDVADADKIIGDMQQQAVFMPIGVIMQQQPDEAAGYICNMCHQPLIDRNTGKGQMYRPIANTHELLSTRQIIHGAFHYPGRITHMVPVCYCCLCNMMMKAYLDFLSSRPGQPAPVEKSEILYGISGLADSHELNDGLSMKCH